MNATLATLIKLIKSDPNIIDALKLYNFKNNYSYKSILIGLSIIHQNHYCIVSDLNVGRTYIHKKDLKDLISLANSKEIEELINFI